jgi:hypothetical protein
MEDICSGMVIIQNGGYQIMQLNEHFRTRKYGIWDTGNEKIVDTICEYSKEFPDTLYGVLKLDTLTATQLEKLKKLDYFDMFIFIVPAVHYTCDLPHNVKVLYTPTEVNYIPSTPLTVVPFEDKINKVVWRGQTAGHQETPNFRTLLCDTVKDDPRFDCRLVYGSLQPPFDPDYRMPQSEQMKYKGIIAIDGGGWPTIMHWILGSGCVPLVCSMYWTGAQFELVPWKHYVPIATDMSDLFENVEWVLTHDEECKEIIKNAMEFSSKHFNVDTVYKRLKDTVTPTA